METFLDSDPHLRKPQGCATTFEVNHPRPKSNSSSRFWADFSLFAVAIIWGINAAVMKYGVSEVDPFVFNAVRLTVSVFALWLCVLFENRNKKAKKHENRHPHLAWWIIGFSFLSGAVYQLTFLAGISRTTAGNTALIMSSCPMWTAILAVMTTKDRLSSLAWLGLVMTFLGTILVIAQKAEFSAAAATITGNLIVLGAAIAWSVSSVATKPLLNHISAIRLAFWSVLITLPLHWLLAIPKLKTDFAGAFEPWTFGAILYSGFFSTGIALAMWNYGVQKVGAPHASIYQNVIPLVAVVGAWLLIGEVPLSLQIWGGALIIVGLIVMRRSRP